MRKLTRNEIIIICICVTVVVLVAVLIIVILVTHNPKSSKNLEAPEFYNNSTGQMIYYKNPNILTVTINVAIYQDSQRKVALYQNSDIMVPGGLWTLKYSPIEGFTPGQTYYSSAYFSISQGTIKTSITENSFTYLLNQ